VTVGDRDAVLRQIRWCAAVQTLVNCQCKLEENPVGDVEPVQLVMQGSTCDCGTAAMQQFSREFYATLLPTNLPDHRHIIKVILLVP